MRFGLWHNPQTQWSRLSDISTEPPTPDGGIPVEILGPIPPASLLAYDPMTKAAIPNTQLLADLASAEQAEQAEVSDLAQNIATAIQWLNQIDNAPMPAVANLATIQQMSTAIQRLAIIERKLLKLVARRLAGQPVP